MSLEQGGGWGTLAPLGALFSLPCGDSGCPRVPRLGKSTKILHKGLGKNQSGPWVQTRDGRTGHREAPGRLHPSEVVAATGEEASFHPRDRPLGHCPCLRPCRGHRMRRGLGRASGPGVGQGTTDLRHLGPSDKPHTPPFPSRQAGPPIPAASLNPLPCIPRDETKRKLASFLLPPPLCQPFHSSRWPSGNHHQSPIQTWRGQKHYKANGRTPPPPSLKLKGKTET